MRTRGLMFPILFLLAVAGFSFIVMLLWNALLPDIFGIVSINFWQALGLLVLARILFGGIGAGIGKHFHHHRHNPMHDKWLKMTPEQREQFINKRKHFGFGHFFDKENFDWNEHQKAEKRND